MFASPRPTLRPLSWLARSAALLAVCVLLATPYTAPARAASPTTLVKDINTITPSTDGTIFDQVVTVGTTTFFTVALASNSGNTHAGLYTTDGTVSGTSLLAEVEPRALVGYNQKLFFFTNRNSPTNLLQLWSSDGATAGTSVFYSFDASVESVFSTVALPSGLFFLVKDTSGGYSLWRSNGTSAGTSRVYQFAATLGDFPSSLVVVGTTIFLRA